MLEQGTKLFQCFKQKLLISFSNRPKEFSDKESEPVKGGIPNDMLPPSDSEDSGDELRDMCINVNRSAELQTLSTTVRLSH